MKNNELRRLQLNLLDILKYIDEFCKENKIEYYVVYGSCIGAVRHKGFIPWDDDIDIAMTMDNYDKFCKLFSKANTGKYFLQTKKTDPNYNNNFGKIRNTETTLIEFNNKNLNMVFGTYIDIFPLVGVPNNKFKRYIQKLDRTFYLSTEKRVVNNKLLGAIVNLLIKILGKDNIKKRCYKNLIKYDCKSSDNWMSCFASLYEENIHPKEYYGKPKYIQFEDIKVPVPCEYDKYLRHIYGDYMKLPDEEKRKSDQHSSILDLDKPYTYYLK